MTLNLRRGFALLGIVMGSATCAQSGQDLSGDGSADGPLPIHEAGLHDRRAPDAQEAGDDSSGDDSAMTGNPVESGDADAASWEAGTDSGLDGRSGGDVTLPGDATVEGAAESGLLDGQPSEPSGDGPSDAAGEAAPEASEGGGDASEGGSDGSCPADDLYPQSSFVNLAPPPGAPLDRNGGDPIPGDAGVAPSGWHFYQPAGAICRDGSPAGFFVHYTSSTKLMIFLDGGGACDSQGFCSHTPANIDQIFAGGPNAEAQTIANALFLGPGLQQPYTTGIFDPNNAANPFKGYNQIYVPYCTGDVHFGTATNVMVPGVSTPQQFVGYRNMQTFISRIVPTFPGLDQVVLAGSAAGGFGAGLNYGMVQDAFGSVPVLILDDSGPPFPVDYLPACLQKQWRDLWGFDAALPSDCAECRLPDGSGLTNIVYYWRRKYPATRYALVSSMDDQVIELFFAQSWNNCATNDPTQLVLGGLLSDGGTVYANSQFESGLFQMRNTFACTGVLATYYMTGSNHQHIFRDEFYQPLAGGVTMADWVNDFVVNGHMPQVGP